MNRQFSQSVVTCCGLNGKLSRSYVVIDVKRATLQRAANLCRAYPLRAYAAVQLACALTRRNDDVAAGNSPPIFVCAGVTLLSIATLEGLSVESPSKEGGYPHGDETSPWGSRLSTPMTENAATF
jgi:hypothetical protein